MNDLTFLLHQPLFIPAPPLVRRVWVWTNQEAPFWGAACARSFGFPGIPYGWEDNGTALEDYSFFPASAALALEEYSLAAFSFHLRRFVSGPR